MAWVKRNLGLVIGGVVALALMALAGFYLWSKMQEEAAISAQLDESTTRFQQLLRRPVHPGNEQINNIELARQENQRLQLLLAEVRQKVGTNELPKKFSNQEFRALLDNTITELQRDAERWGITLPAKDYWFTFSPQKTAVEFKSMEMLTHQLMDIKAICDILYSAKIHDLTALRRVPASTEDNNPTDFLADTKPKTNNYTIVTPYEIEFEGFSSELARVLEGMMNAKQCFVVRSVGVQKAVERSNDQMIMPGGMPYGGFQGRGGYGMDPRYSRMPVMPAPQQARRPSNVLLDEHKLKFIVKVDAVRLKPDNRPGALARNSADPAFDQMSQ